jgi:hypothetical protein
MTVTVVADACAFDLTYLSGCPPVLKISPSPHFVQ